jgi:hypothetical protein
VYALATCTASILRGTTVDEYQDVVDSDTAVYTGVLFSIQETNSSVFDPATQTRRVVRRLVAACQSDTDLQIGDRVRDDTHGITYIVNNVTQPGGVGWDSDLAVDLKRITPAQ